jgi:hypothetical protein
MNGLAGAPVELNFFIGLKSPVGLCCRYSVTGAALELDGAYHFADAWCDLGAEAGSIEDAVVADARLNIMIVLIEG